MSIELPNGKISLTLPEQVGKNAKDIEDIKKLIDGLDSLDNVVVVPDISHIMTAEELKSVRQPVCFIVYDNHLYIKRKEESGNAYFEIVFSIVATTVITFQSSEIQVNLSNGALGIVNSTVSTYSSTKVDELLALKANITYVDSNFAKLSGANFTGNITAPSIIENMSGYAFSAITKEGIAITTIYAGAVKTGNKLTIVWFGSLERSDTVADGWCGIGSFEVPAAVAAKIYNHTIGFISNSVDDQIIPAFDSPTSHVDIYAHVAKATGSNYLFPRLYGVNSLTANTKYIMRYEVTFLLNDSLAA